jgi:hypothetical protein
VGGSALGYCYLRAYFRIIGLVAPLGRQFFYSDFSRCGRPGEFSISVCLAK